MLPSAMLFGAFFYNFFEGLSFLIPYLIVMMLFITYCKLSLRELKITRLHLWILMIQLFGSMLAYGLLRLYDPVVAEGVLVCILVPTATSASVITGMLGGSVASMATTSLLGGLITAFSAPVIFSLIGGSGDLSFINTFLYICIQVMPLLILPFVGALLLERLFPAVHRSLRKLQILSFYLWVFALTIVSGRTCAFIFAQNSPDYRQEWTIAFVSLAVCIAQFLLGRRIGRRYDDPVAGGQSLGQKNTVLAIWMAQNYLSPLASLAPAAYVLWQNSINSWQLWRKNRKHNSTPEHC